MVNSGVEPNVHTYGALIDGCARAGQVAKAFGACGIMRSKVQYLQHLFLIKYCVTGICRVPLTIVNSTY
jgi:pentatricopeptide repeat protein